MNESLECDIPIYQRSYFVFDPEDVVRNGAGVIQRLLVTTGRSVTNKDGVIIQLTSIDFATLLNAVFWGALVVFLTLVLLVCTCIAQCCLGCLCALRREKEKKLLAPKVCCGIFTSILVIFTLGCGAVLIWSESMVDAGVVLHHNQTLQYAQDTLTSPEDTLSVQSGLRIYYDIQFLRHWVSIGVLGLSLVNMLLALLAVCLCAPAAKSAALIVLMLILTCLLTFIVAGAAGAALWSLFYVSSLCYDLYRVGGSSRCNDPGLMELSLSLQLYCGTDVVNPLYITVGVYFILILLLIIWQVAGSCYAATYVRNKSQRGRDDSTVSRSEEHTVITEEHTVTTNPFPLHNEHSYVQPNILLPMNHFQAPIRYGQLQPYIPYPTSPLHPTSFIGQPAPGYGQQFSQPDYRNQDSQLQTPTGLAGNPTAPLRPFQPLLPPPPQYHELNDPNEHGETRYSSNDSSRAPNEEDIM